MTHFPFIDKNVGILPDYLWLSESGEYVLFRCLP